MQNIVDLRMTLGEEFRINIVITGVAENRSQISCKFNSD